MAIKIDFSIFDTNFGTVTNPNIFNNYKDEFSEDGLYSQRIFGPLKDYECKCGNLQGIIHEGKVCDNCGVKCTTSDMRASQFGQILLPNKVYVYLPPLEYIAHKVFGKSNFVRVTKFDPHIYDAEDYFYYDKTKKTLIHQEMVTRNSDIIDDFRIYSIVDLHKLYNYLYEETTVLEELGIDKSIAKYLFINKVLVTPPETRPVVKLGAKKYTINELTKYYSEILKNISNSFIDSVYTSIENDEHESNMYIAASYKKFQQSVNNIYELILAKQLGEKRSIIRQSLLGKTTEFAGRMVITAGPNVAPYMVSISADSAKKLFILETLHYMLENDEIDVGDLVDIMNLIIRGFKHSELELSTEEFTRIFNEIRPNLQAIAERPPSLFLYNISTVLFDKLYDEKFKIEEREWDTLQNSKAACMSN